MTSRTDTLKMPHLTHEERIAELEAVVEQGKQRMHCQLEEIRALHRRVAAAELTSRLGWERWESANNGHMDARRALADANAEIWRLKNG